MRDLSKVKIDDVCCKSISKINSKFSNVINYIDISSIDNEIKEIISYQEIDISNAPSRAKQILKVGDILVSMVRPNLNAVAMVKDNGRTYVASTGYSVLRCTNKINNVYLFYFCQSKSFINTLTVQATGASYPAVSNKIIRNCLVNLPSLSEQQQIADTLDKVSDLIAKRKQQLEKLDLLVKSRFVEMFGDPIVNDKNWNISKLSEYLNVIGGYAFKSSDFKEKGIPVLRIGNINSGYFTATNMVFWENESNLERYKMFPGDLVMSLTGTVGKDDYGNVCILGDEYNEYYLNQRNAKLEILGNIDKLYLSELLKVPRIKKQLTGISRGVRQANISNKDILNLSVPIPPIKLQNKFADFVTAIEQQKEKIKKGLETLETLKASLMQKYFG